MQVFRQAAYPVQVVHQELTSTGPHHFQEKNKDRRITFHHLETEINTYPTQIVQLVPWNKISAEGLQILWPVCLLLSAEISLGCVCCLVIPCWTQKWSFLSFLSQQGAFLCLPLKIHFFLYLNPGFHLPIVGNVKFLTVENNSLKLLFFPLVSFLPPSWFIWMILMFGRRNWELLFHQSTWAANKTMKLETQPSVQSAPPPHCCSKCCFCHLENWCSERKQVTHPKVT